MTFLVRDTSVNQLGFKAHKSLVVYVHSGKGVGHYVIMRRILHYRISCYFRSDLNFGCFEEALLFEIKI